MLGLTEEHEKMRSEFREFVNAEIMPYAGQNDMNEKIEPSIIKKLKETGYLGSMIPVQYGGKGFGEVLTGFLNEEIGRGCSSVRGLLTVHGMVAHAIHRWGTEKQRELLLPSMAKGDIIGAFALTEPEIGSDANNIKTEAILSEDSYILNGKKKWITMAGIADIFLVFAICEGKPTTFLVEKNCPGLTIKPITGLSGMRASMSAELIFENCIVPKDNIIGCIGMGISHVALSSLDYGRYTVAWGCVGIGQACLEASVKYSRKRKQFGVALRQHQLIQKMVTEMVTSLKAARMLCLNAGYLKEKGSPESIMETWVAKYFASKMAFEVANHAVQIHGANGCSYEYPVERYLRDAKICEIIEGTSQMHEILIAVNAFREHY